MDPTTAAAGLSVTAITQIVTQTGMAGMVFIIWLMDSRKQDALKKVIEEQIADKAAIRADTDRHIKAQEIMNTQLLEVIKSSATREERTQELLRQTTEVLKGVTHVLTKLEAKR